ncbi:MAG TPA: hypothetical protein VIB99_04370, partial [Candidatus Limnocylindrales bacterium]
MTEPGCTWTGAIGAIGLTEGSDRGVGRDAGVAEAPAGLADGLPAGLGDGAPVGELEGELGALLGHGVGRPDPPADGLGPG